MAKGDFEYRTFTRLKQREYLIWTQQIDPQFFGAMAPERNDPLADNFG